MFSVTKSSDKFTKPIEIVTNSVKSPVPIEIVTKSSENAQAHRYCHKTRQI